MAENNNSTFIIKMWFVAIFAAALIAYFGTLVAVLRLPTRPDQVIQDGLRGPATPPSHQPVPGGTR